MTVFVCRTLTCESGSIGASAPSLCGEVLERKGKEGKGVAFLACGSVAVLDSVLAVLCFR